MPNLVHPAPIPAPTTVDGVDSPILELSAGWCFTSTPSSDFWTIDHDIEAWSPIDVPGEPAMQGFTVDFDAEVAYRLDVHVPDGFAHRTIILRFDGVYDAARVWVNGVHVGEHRGGFTRFEFDVTHLIFAGRPNLIVVGVTDRSASVSLASRYAFHPIGGILRPVSLIAVPHTHLNRVDVETPIDDPASGRGTLRLTVEATDRAEVTVALTDPHGLPVELSEGDHYRLLGLGSRQVLEFRLDNLRLWSDETPALYDLTVTVDAADGRSTVRRRVGFRSVEVVGNELRVNGRSVFLKGVNHHDMHPLLGRSSDGSMDRLDLALFKQANLNFVRTSHYPPHEALLDAADELGIYVEVENAVCWADQFGWPATQDEPRYLAEYLGQLAEMIDLGRNHASVVIWSLGNESTWGENFEKSFEYVTAVEPSRPIIMSFPGGPEQIVSSHYPPYGSDLESSERPTLYDEVVHTPVYQAGALRRDPSLHSDWAAHLSDFVSKLRSSNGALGLAIWSGIDEVFELPTGTVGFGEWGLVDVRRRRKPEWWAARRTFSPIQLTGPARWLTDGTIEIPVTNRHAFLNLDTIALVWRAGASSGRVHGPHIAPGDAGHLIVRPEAGGDEVTLELFSSTGSLLDRHTVRRLAGNDRAPGPSLVQSQHPALHRDGNLVSVGDETGRIRFAIDATTGQINASGADGRPIGTGPALHAIGKDLGPWRLDSFDLDAGTSEPVARVSGTHGPVHVAYEHRFGANSTVMTSFSITGLEMAGPGWISEVGISFLLTDAISRTEWRAADDGMRSSGVHLGRSAGRAWRDSADDTRDPQASWERLGGGAGSVLGDWSRDFRARRSGVTRQRVDDPSGRGIEILSDGSISTRLFPERTTVLPVDDAITMTGEWSHQGVQGGLNQGHTGAFEYRSDDAAAAIEIAFVGSGIDCIGSLGPDLGQVDILLDGHAIARAVELFSPVDTPGFVIHSLRDLGAGSHSLRIESTGVRNEFATGTGFRFDSFEVFPERPRVVVAVLARNTFPVTGFDWADPETAAVDVSRAIEGRVEWRLVGPEVELSDAD